MPGVVRYAAASTTVGVLFSVLLTNKCTLGKGAPTCKTCWRIVRMLCFDDCCCGRRRQSQEGVRAPLLGEANSHARSGIATSDSTRVSAGQRLSINSEDAAGDSDAHQHTSIAVSRRASDASDESVHAATADDAANLRCAQLQAQNAALAEQVETKSRECAALQLRVVELEQELGRRKHEQARTSGSRPSAPTGSE